MVVIKHIVTAYYTAVWLAYMGLCRGGGALFQPSDQPSLICLDVELFFQTIDCFIYKYVFCILPDAVLKINW